MPKRRDERGLLIRNISGTHNVDADKGNQHPLSGEIADRDSNTNNGNDVLADTHAHGANKEESATTEALHTPDTGHSHNHVYNIGDDCDQEGILNTRVFEEGSAVVEDEIYTGQLLPSGQLLVSYSKAEENSETYAWMKMPVSVRRQILL
jgi:hypothetical protein